MDVAVGADRLLVAWAAIGSGAAGRTGGRGNNKKGQGGKSAKEWEELKDQEARQQLIRDRRERLMDLDRKVGQEAWLSAQRTNEADDAGRASDVR